MYLSPLSPHFHTPSGRTSGRINILLLGKLCFYSGSTKYPVVVPELDNFIVHTIVLVCYCCLLFYASVTAVIISIVVFDARAAC
jgi:hypothetical protein